MLQIERALKYKNIVWYKKYIFNFIEFFMNVIRILGDYIKKKSNTYIYGILDKYSKTMLNLYL